MNLFISYRHALYGLNEIQLIVKSFVPYLNISHVRYPSYGHGVDYVILLPEAQYM